MKGLGVERLRAEGLGCWVSINACLPAQGACGVNEAHVSVSRMWDNTHPITSVYRGTKAEDPPFETPNNMAPRDYNFREGV